MMVAVDVSTVLTYTVGALPTSLLAQTDLQLNSKMHGLSVVSDF